MYNISNLQGNSYREHDQFILEDKYLTKINNEIYIVLANSKNIIYITNNQLSMTRYIAWNESTITNNNHVFTKFIEIMLRSHSNELRHITIRKG